MNRTIVIKSEDESRLRKEIENRTDFESLRMKRYLNMPDLSRKNDSPLKAIIDMVLKIDRFKDFDIIEIPEIVPADVSFDLFNFPLNHVARSKSDTYYAEENQILRTHDTVMWYYYLNNPKIKEKIKNKEDLGVICYGKVYRKDEIDRKHMNVFHQMGGLFLTPDDKKILELKDLENVLSEIVKTLFGNDIVYRFNKDTFPYTDPSLEVEVEVDGNWIEILGGGMPLKLVLKNFNVEGYNGWAFGFGLERLAIINMHLPDIRLLWSEDERVKKQLKLGNHFVEVSKFPPVSRDISFVVDKSFIPNDYFDLIREIGKDLIEEVELKDKYENEQKFGKDKISYTYHIIYRSNEKTLTGEEVDLIQNKIYQKTKETYNAELR